MEDRRQIRSGEQGQARDRALLRVRRGAVLMGATATAAAAGLGVLVASDTAARSATPVTGGTTSSGSAGSSPSSPSSSTGSSSSSPTAPSSTAQAPTTVSGQS